MRSWPSVFSLHTAVAENSGPVKHNSNSDDVVEAREIRQGSLSTLGHAYAIADGSDIAMTEVETQPKIPDRIHVQTRFESELGQA